MTSDEFATYNYHVLAKRDPKLAQIIHSSSICNVYKFNEDDGEWDKLEFQGPLFIYSRRDDPKKPYGLLVLNRVDTNLFSLAIIPNSLAASEDSKMEVKLEEPFIMTQAADGSVYGLWIYNEKERPQVVKTIQWCLDVTT